jgi:hypothetical protein
LIDAQRVTNVAVLETNIEDPVNRAFASRRGRRRRDHDEMKSVRERSLVIIEATTRRRAAGYHRDDDEEFASRRARTAVNNRCGIDAIDDDYNYS